MIKPFNLTHGWKYWNRAKFAEGEVKEYLSYQNKRRDRIVLFNSADEMISNFRKNHVVYGGTAWTNTENMQMDMEKEDTWRFGTDFKTLETTNEALEAGKMAEKYMKTVEETKQDLFQKFPKLYDLTAAATTKKQRREWASEGDELEMNKFFNGEENAFQRKRKKDTKVIVARIYIDICVNGHTSTEVVTKNMIYGLAMADIVETAGIPVELIVGATTNGGTSDTRLYNVSCIAKDAEDPFDISRILTFALPGVFREYIFGIWSNLTDGRPSGGLGHACDSDDEMMPIQDFLDSDVFIRGGSGMMRPGQIKAIIDKIAHIFNMNIHGSGYAEGDGQFAYGEHGMDYEERDQMQDYYNKYKKEFEEDNGFNDDLDDEDEEGDNWGQYGSDEDDEEED